MDHPSSDSSTDEEGVFRNRVISHNIPSTSEEESGEEEKENIGNNLKKPKRVWLCASDPPRVLTEEEKKEKEALEAQRQERARQDYEDRIDDLKIFTPDDDNKIITYIVESKKYNQAHREISWRHLSSTDMMMPRRSARALRKRFFQLVKLEDYQFYTCHRDALHVFKNYRRKLIAKFLSS